MPESLPRFRLKFHHELGTFANADELWIILGVVDDYRRTVAGVGAIDALGRYDIAFSVFLVDVGVHFRSMQIIRNRISAAILPSPA